MASKVTRKVKSKRPPLLDAVIDGDASRMVSLLAAGEDPNATDAAGWTALHFAAQRQDEAQIIVLLGAGAIVDAADGNGNTPLSTAVFTYRGDPRSIQALRLAGADVDKANAHGVSAYSLAHQIANTDVRTLF